MCVQRNLETYDLIYETSKLGCMLDSPTVNWDACWTVQLSTGMHAGQSNCQLGRMLDSPTVNWDACWTVQPSTGMHAGQSNCPTVNWDACWTVQLSTGMHAGQSNCQLGCMPDSPTVNCSLCYPQAQCHCIELAAITHIKSSRTWVHSCTHMQTLVAWHDTHHANCKIQLLVDV